MDENKSGKTDTNLQDSIKETQVVQDQSTEFMRETIKQRPVNKKKLARKTLITAAMAVVFSIVACLTFLLLEPVISNWLYPEETAGTVEFPEEEQEMLPEDMVGTEDATLENEQIEQIQQILSNADVDLDVGSYAQMYDSLSSLANTTAQSMVTVTGVSSDKDWFDNTYESKGQSSGVIIADNGVELLILANESAITDAEEIQITFFNGATASGSVKRQDENTGYAIVAIAHSDLSSDLQSKLPVVTLGNSEYSYLTGKPVIAIGSPMGTSSSICYGVVTSADSIVTMADVNYKLVTTDIYGSQNASGILINLSGQMVGMINNAYSPSDSQNAITALGINELKKIIEKMSNGIPVAYLGINGTDVTADAHSRLRVPYGAYVTGIVMDSPAMTAGIQSGDIIVKFDETEILKYKDFTNAMMEQTPGTTHTLTIERQGQNDYREITCDVTLK
ncbi:MAG: PDZ domain-containing protein [Lachnospiraceae bacterium]|nr:PDZ domain-containing protein [Lachnospiraceae bacterium]